MVPQLYNWMIFTSKVLFYLSFLLLCADSSIIQARFSAKLTEGPLNDYAFEGKFSYDDSRCTSGYCFLNSLDFVFRGLPFNKTMIEQGGQAIIQNVLYFTASFQGGIYNGTGVENLTFGFGGPTVIVYITDNGTFGSGTFICTMTSHDSVKKRR